MASSTDTAIFLSTCGGTLDESIDVAALRSKLKSISGLRVYEAEHWSRPGDREDMSKRIGKEPASAVVLAGASLMSATTEPWLDVKGEDGLRIQSANLREQCGWVHNDRKVATSKAERLVRIAVARAREASRLHLVNHRVSRRIGVIGGGQEAYEVARSLAASGLEVILIPSPSQPAPLRPVQDETRKQVEKTKGVTITEPAMPEDLGGAVGEFNLTVSAGGKQVVHGVGAVVIAVDATQGPLVKPTGLENHAGVVSLDDFAIGDESLSVCVRLDVQEFARKVDAHRAMGMLTEHADAGGRAMVLFRHVPVFGIDGQARYDRARLAGVRFIRMTKQPARFEAKGKQILVTVRDEVLPDRELTATVDRLVVPRPIEPCSGYQKLSKMLRQPMDREGYMQPSNIRHGPLGASRRGIFFVGRCHQDTDDAGSTQEAAALAGQVLGVLPAEGTQQVPEERLVVDIARCATCLTCLRICPHGAITMRDGGKSPSVEVSDTACFECGLCASACPQNAITHGSVSSRQLRDAIDVASEPFDGKPTLVVLACRQGAVQAADGAGRQGIELPPRAMILDVPCAGRVSETHILHAMIEGAGGVLVLGCHPDNCRSLHGNTSAHGKADRVKRSLGALGMDDRRVTFESVASNESARLAHILEKTIAVIDESADGAKE